MERPVLSIDCAGVSDEAPDGGVVVLTEILEEAAVVPEAGEETVEGAADCTGLVFPGDLAFGRDAGGEGKRVVGTC